MNASQTLRAQRNSYGTTCGNLARNCTRLGYRVAGRIQDITGENPLTETEKATATAFTPIEGVEHGHRIAANLYWLAQCGPNLGQDIFCA